MARHYCRRCLKAGAACICDWIYPVSNSTDIVILQHPDEVKKALGTARIATLSLERVAMWVGVDFTDHPQFNRLLSGSPDSIAVLYPSETAIDIDEWERNIVSGDKDSSPITLPVDEYKKRTLIVIDGTWRNTREIMMANQGLQELPKVKLSPVKASNYRIRKAPSSESLSTVEAIAMALNSLEPDTPVDSMLDCFSKMIDYQIACMGEDVYRKNYIDKV